MIQTVKSYIEFQSKKYFESDIKELLTEPCPHGTFGGYEHCMACNPEAKRKAENKRQEILKNNKREMMRK